MALQAELGLPFYAQSLWLISQFLFRSTPPSGRVAELGSLAAMRATLHIIQIVCGLICLALAFYGISQFEAMGGEDFFDHFGRAAFSFLVAYGCARIVRAAQKKIDRIDAVEDPHALTSRLMSEASERLGDLSHVDERIARKRIEQELDRIEQQEREARGQSRSTKEVAAIAVAGGLAELGFARLSPRTQRHVKVFAWGAAASTLTAFVGYFAFRLASLSSLVIESGGSGWVLLALFLFVSIAAYLWFEFYRALKTGVSR